MNQNAVQIELFERIKPRLKKREAVSELAGLLHLSHSAVYKRLNGTVPITMEEFVLLCQQFEISADELLGFSRSTLMFSQPITKEKLKSYNDFLEVILNELKRLAGENDVEIWYVTNEIPFFHQFLYPELSAFKYYYYARHVWELPAFQKHLFSLDNFWLQQPSRDKGRQLLRYYYQFPGVEIWTPQILDNTLNQIRYFLGTGAFRHIRDVIRVIDALRLMVRHFRGMCERGRKFMPHQRIEGQGPSFFAYYNQINFSNNTFLVNSPDHTQVYMTYDNPNFLKNEQPSFARYTRQWFHKLKKRSTPLALSNEQSRDHFFNGLLQKLDQFESEIQADINKSHSIAG